MGDNQGWLYSRKDFPPEQQAGNVHMPSWSADLNLQPSSEVSVLIILHFCSVHGLDLVIHRSLLYPFQALMSCVFSLFPLNSNIQKFSEPLLLAQGKSLYKT